MRERVVDLAAKWKKLGHDLGFGVGIAHGYATLGRVSSEGRFDYTAIGRVVNLAARLCGEAKSGQILIDGKVHTAVETLADTAAVGELELKGFYPPGRRLRRARNSRIAGPWRRIVQTESPAPQRFTIPLKRGGRFASANRAGIMGRLIPAVTLPFSRGGKALPSSSALQIGTDQPC